MLESNVAKDMEQKGKVLLLSDLQPGRIQLRWDSEESCQLDGKDAHLDQRLG